ncbi:unnamed protein product [Cochlearia groenlandica]
MIQFQNELGAGHRLKVNCTSKDNTGHVHYVEYKGTPYDIKFNEAIMGMTRWFCTVQHLHGTKPVHSTIFRAYKGSAFPRCGQIRAYIARLNGIFLSKNRSPPEFKYPWSA